MIQNYSKAFRYLKRAADQQHPEAMRYVAKQYDIGLGMEEDKKQAFFWWHSLAQTSDPEALYQAGYMCQHGIGTDCDYLQAENYYTQLISKKSTANVYARAACLNCLPMVFENEMTRCIGSFDLTVYNEMMAVRERILYLWSRSIEYRLRHLLQIDLVFYTQLNRYLNNNNNFSFESLDARYNELTRSVKKDFISTKELLSHLRLSTQDLGIKMSDVVDKIIELTSLDVVIMSNRYDNLTEDELVLLSRDFDMLSIEEIRGVLRAIQDTVSDLEKKYRYKKDKKYWHVIWRRADPDVHLFYKMNLKRQLPKLEKKRKESLQTERDELFAKL